MEMLMSDEAVEDKDLQANDVLLLLQKHEAECNLRYQAINDKLVSQSKTLDTLDMRMWGIAGLIIATFVAEKFV